MAFCHKFYVFCIHKTFFPGEHIIFLTGIGKINTPVNDLFVGFISLYGGVYGIIKIIVSIVALFRVGDGIQPVNSTIRPGYFSVEAGGDIEGKFSYGMRGLKLN
ncbi:hypothetical protein LVD17_15405 [Fulvivirga ulvae]|uniref:hypothetical protein n=1 Tax=Fulvivirga ulvae TaxID=2904245 RepID=UPI001F41721E|nr:hypothetical protein [Fulvivirga ulvae]UII29686.1 hypothetical protein LVD17_15405 [Fulvivirga ulvae]